MNGDQLGGWKDIAQYLGVSVRTVQEWEKIAQLPIHRATGVKGRVYAYTHELDAWRNRQNQRPDSPATQEAVSDNSGDPPPTPAPSRRRWLLAACAAVVVALGAIVIHGGALQNVRNQSTASLRLDANDVVGLDQQGTERWRYRVPNGFTSNYLRSHPMGDVSWFGDLDGDGEREALFVYIPQSHETRGAKLFCFSDSGQLKWQFSPGRSVSDARQQFTSVYYISAMLVLPPDDIGKRRVVLGGNHSVHYPTQVALLDAEGNLQGEYWHPGHLLKMGEWDVDGDGRGEILLAGVNNGLAQAVLVALDSNRIEGTFMLPAGNERQLRDLPPAHEKKVVLFPKTCLSRTFAPFNRVYELRLTKDRVTAIVSESIHYTSSPNPYIIYELDRSLRFISATASDQWHEYHRQREVMGQLSHRFSAGELDVLQQLSYLQR